jgi:hypothetical protein
VLIDMPINEFEDVVFWVSVKGGKIHAMPIYIND